MPEQKIGQIRKTILKCDLNGFIKNRKLGEDTTTIKGHGVEMEWSGTWG